MPISKNQSKTKLRKNFNNKKSKKPKLKLTKLSGGAGVRANSSRNLFNNISISGINLPNLEDRISKTERYLQYLKEYKKFLKSQNTPQPQSRFKLFSRTQQNPLAPPIFPIELKSQSVSSNFLQEALYEVPVPVPEALYEVPVPGFSGSPEFPPPNPKHLQPHNNDLLRNESQQQNIGNPRRPLPLTPQNAKNLARQNPRFSNLYRNTKQMNILIEKQKRLDNLSNFIDSRITITFCDCKIILLYIYVFDLIPKKNKEIKQLLKQPSVSGTTIVTKNTLQLNKNPFAVNNGNLIQFTLDIIFELLHKKKEKITFDRCNEITFDEYLKSELNKINYKILFNTKTESEYNIIVNNLLQIFKKEGNINEKFNLQILEEMNPFIFKEEIYYSTVKGDGRDEGNYVLLDEEERDEEA